MPDSDTTLPEVGSTLPQCGTYGCPAPDFQIGFGLAGGGYGVYEYCEVCQRVVTKTQEKLEDHDGQ